MNLLCIRKAIFANFFFFLFLSCIAEKGLEHEQAFFGENPLSDIAGVIEWGGGLQKIDPPAAGSGFRIWAAENYA